MTEFYSPFGSPLLDTLGFPQMVWSQFFESLEVFSRYSENLKFINTEDQTDSLGGTDVVIDSWLASIGNSCFIWYVAASLDGSKIQSGLLGISWKDDGTVGDMFQTDWPGIGTTSTLLLEFDYGVVAGKGDCIKMLLTDTTEYWNLKMFRVVL